MSGAVRRKVTCWSIGLVVLSGGPQPPGGHVHVVALKDPAPLTLHLQKKEVSVAKGSRDTDMSWEELKDLGDNYSQHGQ